MNDKILVNKDHLDRWVYVNVGKVSTSKARFLMWQGGLRAEKKRKIKWSYYSNRKRK